MSNELATIEHQLHQIQPRFEQLLMGSGVPAERVIRTTLVSIERVPRLLECNRQSVINAAISFGCLQLECDGPTGQGYILPFKNRAQPIIGYKGYNTLAGRSGYTINASVIREGDYFKESRGSQAAIIHEPVLDGQGKIIGAYAVATSLTRPPIVAPALGIREIMAVKSKAPGGGKSDSPWNDPDVGFPAMAIKTAIRRLWRYMPLNLGAVANAMETVHEVYQTPTYIHPEHGVIAETIPPAERAELEHRSSGRLVIIKSDGSERVSPTLEQWRAGIALAVNSIRDVDQARAFLERMAPVFAELEEEHGLEVKLARESVEDLVEDLEARS